MSTLVRASYKVPLSSQGAAALAATCAAEGGAGALGSLLLLPGQEGACAVVPAADAVGALPRLSLRAHPDLGLPPYVVRSPQPSVLSSVFTIVTVGAVGFGLMHPCHAKLMLSDLCVQGAGSVLRDNPDSGPASRGGVASSGGGGGSGGSRSAGTVIIAAVVAAGVAAVLVVAVAGVVVRRRRRQAWAEETAKGEVGNQPGYGGLRPLDFLSLVIQVHVASIVVAFMLIPFFGLPAVR